MDIKLAIGDVFDNLLVDPGPAGENIDGCAEGIRRITWVWFRIRWGSWSAVCLFKRIEPVHELCERVLDSLTEFSLVFFHGRLEILETSFNVNDRGRSGLRQR